MRSANAELTTRLQQLDIKSEELKNDNVELVELVQ